MLSFLALSAGTAVLMARSSAFANGDCGSQGQAFGTIATQWPTPSSGLGSYVNSYSSAHNGIFSNCEDFTSHMPSSLTSNYDAWVTSVSAWSVSLESAVSAAASTCPGLNANPVIVIPTSCADSAGSETDPSGSPAPSATPSASATSSSGDNVSSVASTNLGGIQIIAVGICVGVVGALAFVQ